MTGVTGSDRTDDGQTAAAPATAGAGARGVGGADRPDLVKGDGESTRSRLVRDLFSRRSLALGSTASDRFWGWAGPLAVALVAAVLRLVNLGNPRTLVFDETYYVKGAYTLLTLGYEADWPDDPDEAFESGDQDGYVARPDYVVHPPLGKWMIAAGMRLGGSENPWAWRLSAAVVGALAVFLLARTARRLFGSTAVGILAGALFALDGVAIVHARTGLLDGFLMLWVLVAFACLVRDREWSRRRLAERAAALVDSGRGLGRWGPATGVRWWRFAAAVALGLACGTKWSGLYFVAVLCVLSVAWDATARRTIGVRAWPVAALVRDALPAMAVVLPTVFLMYLASWAAWFADSRSYNRWWAGKHPVDYPTWVPDAMASRLGPFESLWAYHTKMWEFHTGLTNPHTYEANPWGWLVQWRPTSFYWRKTTMGEGGCGADECARAITSIGNPLIWWLATLGLLVAIWALVRLRDWRAGAVLSGVLAGWVPWLFLTERTVFTFYVIAFAPWMYLSLAYVVALGWEMVEDRGEVARRQYRRVVGVVLGCVLAASIFFYPLWTGMEVPYWFWQAHMWLDSWI
jgi:dolichyl-phosphate-mannose-protein mannosyltransferase